MESAWPRRDCGKVAPMEGTVSASRELSAPPARVFAVIADYRTAHPAILPRQYFTKLDVLEGGSGAGTRLRGEMRVYGRVVTFEHTVSEPEPGRVLLEKDVAGTTETRFTVDALASGSRLTIETRFRTEREGLLGKLERWMTAGFLRKVYVEELELIERYCATSAPISSQ